MRLNKLLLLIYVLLLSFSCDSSSSCSECDLVGQWYGYSGYIDDSGNTVSYRPFTGGTLSEEVEHADMILRFIDSDFSRLIIDATPLYEFRDDCNLIFVMRDFGKYSTSSNCSSIDVGDAASAFDLREYSNDVRKIGESGLVIRL